MCQLQQPTPRRPNNKQVIYKYIESKPGVNQRELCILLGVQKSTLRESLLPLIDMKYVTAKVSKYGKKSYYIDKRRKY